MCLLRAFVFILARKISHDEGARRTTSTLFRQWEPHTHRTRRCVKLPKSVPSPGNRAKRDFPNTKANNSTLQPPDVKSAGPTILKQCGSGNRSLSSPRKCSCLLSEPRKGQEPQTAPRRQKHYVRDTETGWEPNPRPEDISAYKQKLTPDLRHKATNKKRNNNNNNSNNCQTKRPKTISFQER